MKFDPNIMTTDILNTMVDNFVKDSPMIDTNAESDQTYDDELCACGLPINECPDNYDHITHGV
jgi:hypothetical protein